MLKIWWTIHSIAFVVATENIILWTVDRGWTILQAVAVIMEATDESRITFITYLTITFSSLWRLPCDSAAGRRKGAQGLVNLWLEKERKCPWKIECYTRSTLCYPRLRDTPGSYQRLDLFIQVLRVLCPNLTDASTAGSGRGIEREELVEQPLMTRPPVPSEGFQILWLVVQA